MTHGELVMNQPFIAFNDVDEGNNPSGGYADGLGFHIDWQNGPLSVDGNRGQSNGAFVETIIAAAKQRIEFYQDSKFNCDENEQAIMYLGLALNSLNARTQCRIKAGVEGTHEGN
jgi:hypothetical protein